MAVLPTPGSPINSGLFLVLRDKICNTRLISSSRPITGSSLPFFASSLRLRAYLFNALKVSSPLDEVTFWPLRMPSIPVFNPSCVIPASFNKREMVSFPATIPSKICSMVTNSSPILVFSLSATLNAFCASLLRYGVPPVTFGYVLTIFSSAATVPGMFTPILLNRNGNTCASTVNNPFNK